MNEESTEKRTSETCKESCQIGSNMFVMKMQRTPLQGKESGKRMPKRQATSELNQDNWDKEEEQEDPGTFHKVSEKGLQGRVIKVAKRRTRTSGEDVRSPFSAFSGFPTKSSGKLPDFSFLTKKPTVSNGASETKQNGLLAETSPTTDSDSKTQPKEPSRDFEYYRQLKVLNESFVKWIHMHLTKNPYCDFTPVVKDYQTHIQALDTKFPLHKSDSSKVFTTSCISTSAGSPLASSSVAGKCLATVPTLAFMKKATTDSPCGSTVTTPFCTSTSTFSFGTKSAVTSGSSGAPVNSFATATTAFPTSTTPTFSFGTKSARCASSSGAPVNCNVITTGSDQKTTTTSSNSQPIPNFGTSAVSTTGSTFPGFSFKSSACEPKPFTFVCTAPAASDTKDQSDVNDEDTYEPPKNDFTPVAEQDSFYSTRCKLFYKKEETFIDRGVGMLHLKPLNGKTQLLVRADTNLGNILLNILLSDSLPIQRMGKNNVLIICVPNPPVDPKQTDSSEPTTFLIRVKTSEEADKLFEKLNETKS